MADVKPIPDGYHNVTPYLVVDRGADAIEFYKQALGATERVRLAQPDGKIGHAELEIGDSVIMLCDEYPEMNALARAPKLVGPDDDGSRTRSASAAFVSQQARQLAGELAERSHQFAS